MSDKLFAVQGVSLVLASASPRRRELLHGAGLDFLAVNPEDGGVFHEPVPAAGEAPESYALRAASAKAQAVAAQYPDAVVIGSDTIVVLREAGSGPVILGKPRDEEDALRMLRCLSGKTHEVITACRIIVPSGLCGRRQEAVFSGVIPEGEQHDVLPFAAAQNGMAGGAAFADVSEVTFGSWPDEVLRAYAYCGEPLDKAGAYAVQGRGGALVNSVRGSWSTVVGLPVPRLLRALWRLGLVCAAEPGL